LKKTLLHCEMACHNVIKAFDAFLTASRNAIEAFHDEVKACCGLNQAFIHSLTAYANAIKASHSAIKACNIASQAWLSCHKAV